MKICPFIMMLLMVLACDTADHGIEQVFPGPGFEKGWSWKNMPEKVEIEDLLPEEAKLYRSNGVKEVSAVTYFWGSPDDTAFTVYVADMDSEHAGRVVVQAIAEMHQVKVDSAGLELSGKMVFSRAKYTVTLKTTNGSDKVKNGMHVIAEQLMKRIDEQKGN